MLLGYTTSHFSFSSHAQMGYTIVDEACLQPLASG
jgi:formylmethanofuran dehydrogenase subunit A